MKKLKLKALELGAADVLTRAQLKNVLGGDEGSGMYHVCGRTYTNGQCYCDICYNYQPVPGRCGEPCMAGVSQETCLNGW